LLEEVLGSDAQLNGMVRQAFQMMLAYWVWLKKETYWVCGYVLSRKGARRTRELVAQPSKHAAGLAFGLVNQVKVEKAKPKNHEQLHVPDDNERNGAIQKYHTGPTEHNHIFLVKRLAHATQRGRETLERLLIGHRKVMS
jgi:hypothetical protein